MAGWVYLPLKKFVHNSDRESLTNDFSQQLDNTGFKIKVKLNKIETVVSRNSVPKLSFRLEVPELLKVISIMLISMLKC